MRHGSLMFYEDDDALSYNKVLCDEAPPAYEKKIAFHLGEMPALYCSFPQFADLRSDRHVWRVFPEDEGFVASLAEMCRTIWLRNNGKEESDYRHR